MRTHCVTIGIHGKEPVNTSLIALGWKWLQGATNIWWLQNIFSYKSVVFNALPNKQITESHHEKNYDWLPFIVAKYAVEVTIGKTILFFYSKSRKSLTECHEPMTKPTLFPNGQDKNWTYNYHQCRHKHPKPLDPPPVFLHHVI